MTTVAMEMRKYFPKGRPRLLSAVLETFIRRELLDNEPRGLRTVQNASYYADGLTRLLDLDSNARNRWSWLIRTDGQDDHPRKSIFYQLGRIRDDGALAVFADELCKRKPKAVVAVRLLRMWQKRLNEV